MTDKKKYLTIDLFAGAGGLSLGLERVGFKVVLANELEVDFSESYKRNHSGRMIQGDVTDIDFRKEIKALGLVPGEIDLVCGGPPCQGFSTVGKKELKDPRNKLYMQFLRCVKEVRPKAVLFENVSGFKKMYGGAVFRALIDDLCALGYKTNHTVLDAADFGLPQHRPRTIVVAWNVPGEFIFPTPSHGLDRTYPYTTLEDAISDLPLLVAGGEQRTYAKPPQNEFQEMMRSNAKDLSEHNCAKYGDHMKEVLELIPPGGSVMDLPEELRPKSYFKNTYARLVPEKPAPTMTRNFGTPSSSRCVHPHQNRALSTREGARLQGFPDDYEFCGGKGSKNLQIGNAVPPILGEVVGKELMILLSGKRKGLPIRGSQLNTNNSLRPSF